jgi:membrane-associated phospholipid phosphatase
MVSTPKKALVAIGLVIVAVALLLPFDAIILGQFVNLLPPQQEGLVKLLSNKGIYPLYAIFLALFIYGFVNNKQHLKQTCMAYLKTQFFFSILLTRVLKIVFGRARPAQGQDWAFFTLESKYDAFPSGHSADAFVSAIFLYYLLKHSNYSNYRYVPICYAASIALTRLMINAHFPSDVLAGAAIGLFGAWFFINRLSASPCQGHPSRASIHK